MPIKTPSFLTPSIAQNTPRSFSLSIFPFYPPPSSRNSPMEKSGSSYTSNKRSRDEDEEDAATKRLRESLLFDMLSGDEETGGDRDPAAEDVAAVMSSLEEEIGGVLLPPVEESSDSGCSPCQPELGYLLEASDDDLGLPPVTSSDGGDGVVQISGGGEPEDAGFGQIWGFDEDVSGFLGGGGGGFGMGFPPAVVDDGGVFDYEEDELFGGRSNFSDLSWRSESQPAI